MAHFEAPPPPFQCCEEKRENTTHIRADVRSSDPKCQINIERGEGGCWIFFLNLNVKQGVARCSFQLLLSLIVYHLDLTPNRPTSLPFHQACLQGLILLMTNAACLCCYDTGVKNNFYQKRDYKMEDAFHWWVYTRPHLVSWNWRHYTQERVVSFGL